MAITNLDQLVTTTPFPASQIAAGAITTAKLAAALQAMPRTHVMPTIAATGPTEVLFRAPYTGTVTAAAFVGKDALAQHAANYLTFSIRNYGAAGAGNTAILAVVDANTTKTVTGAAIAAYTPFPLTLHGTPANLAVTKGDVLAFVATSAATLANTITEGLAIMEFTPS